MLITAPGALYKDVSKQDFNHYFSGTVMAYKLTENKRRAFIVTSSDGGYIEGSYLTREKELKIKSIPFQAWWDHLDTIIHRMLIFNVGAGSAIWYNRINKNLKKSFPWQSNNIKFYGVISNDDKLMQNVLYNAFSELYGNLLFYPSLPLALLDKKTTVTKEGFLVDVPNARLLFYSTPVGELLPEGRIGLYKRGGEAIKLLLLRCGVERSQFEVLEKNDYETDLNMNNMVYVEGQKPEKWPCGFMIYKPGQIPQETQWRTYRGPYPGGVFLLPGWLFYTSWGE